MYIESIAQLHREGFSIIDDVYSENEVEEIINCIESTEKDGPNLLKTSDLFAIRQLLTVIPELKPRLLNDKLKYLFNHAGWSNYSLTKAIYFDKPMVSNWFVAYHQDLSVSVKEKQNINGYINWTHKRNQYGVQPPIKILEDTITIRIHLDNTTAENGALKVIPKSHLKGILRKENLELKPEEEAVCEVKKGGAMLMKPLTMHASNKTTNKKRRRVIHLEFCPHDLEKPIEWLEGMEFDWNI